MKKGLINYRYLAVIACFMVVSLVFISGCKEDDKYVKIVKEGSMEMHPSIAIGKAFDKFFDDGKWKSFVSTDKERVVEFIGKCTWNNRPATCLIQFLVYDNGQFELHTVAINNVNMNQRDSIAILSKALSGR